MPLLQLPGNKSRNQICAMADEPKIYDFSSTAIRLKRAVWKMRAEALRRYRIRHRGSIDWQDLDKQFTRPRSGRISKASAGSAKLVSPEVKAIITQEQHSARNGCGRRSSTSILSARSNGTPVFEGVKLASVLGRKQSSRAKSSADRILSSRNHDSSMVFNGDDKNAASYQVLDLTVNSGAKSLMSPFGSIEVVRPVYSHSGSNIVSEHGHHTSPELNDESDSKQLTSSARSHASYDDNRSVFDDHTNFEGNIPLLGDLAFSRSHSVQESSVKSRSDSINIGTLNLLADAVQEHEKLDNYFDGVKYGGLSSSCEPPPYNSRQQSGVRNHLFQTATDIEGKQSILSKDRLNDNGETYAGSGNEISVRDKPNDGRSPTNSKLGGGVTPRFDRYIDGNERDGSALSARSSLKSVDLSQELKPSRSSSFMSADEEVDEENDEEPEEPLVEEENDAEDTGAVSQDENITGAEPGDASATLAVGNDEEPEIGSKEEAGDAVDNGDEETSAGTESKLSIGKTEGHESVVEGVDVKGETEGQLDAQSVDDKRFDSRTETESKLSIGHESAMSVEKPVEQPVQREVLSARIAREPNNLMDDSSGGEDDGDDPRKQKRGKSKPADGLSPDTRGDEDEIASEQQFDQDDDKEKIPDDFYYDYVDHVSKPSITDDSGLPVDLLTLHHSFGYECLKRSNLHVIDKDVIVFAAGNIVEIVNVRTQQHTYIRSTSGLGIGALAVHPSKKFLAVAEKGQNPNINVFEYPSLRLYRILRGGTEQAYSFSDFSPDGKLLASAGGDPDYMLTLWDWKQEKIVLRSKAFSQDVFRVTFSSELEGQLTSSGVGHIRFWKMASTFTGLKLQGNLGKFGKKEISDIEGYVELPDGKVLSGSESGNMLLWDGGLIKVEIGRKNHKMCHQGPIQQIIMDEGELMTIGVDGYIRVWDLETVDSADTTDESDVFEMEPMNELKVGNDVQLRCMVKSCDPEEATIWYAQDACGSIWRLDLSFSFTSAPPERLMTYHAGAINGVCTSPLTSLVASTGVDHTVRVFDYVSKTQMCSASFNSAGTTMLWAPKSIDKKGSTILVGFDDGVVRVLNIQKMEGTDQHGRKLTDKSELVLKQALKPHKNRVTTMAIDHKEEILATGSTDGTVFFFSVGDNYEPIGFVKTPSAVTHLDWSPSSFKRNVLLICCAGGQAIELECPDPEKHDASHSYEITGLPTRIHQFKSVKSVIRHEEELAKKAKEEEETRMLEEEERQKRIERGIETESDKNSEDGDEKKEEVDELWQPYIPEKPSPILYGFHAKDEGKFWLSMGEYDAGYLYECEFLNDDAKAKMQRDKLYEPSRVIPIHSTNDFPIRTMMFSQSNKHLFLGMGDGAVRMQPLHGDDAGLMGPYWNLTVHDNTYGAVSSLAMSHDFRFLFSVGLDGNFFAFSVAEDKRLEKKSIEDRATVPSAKKELTELRIDDIADPKAYSIEDAKQKAEYDKMLQMAEQKKTAVREEIQSLRDQFQKLVARNSTLPPHLMINRKEFEMDPDIQKELLRQKDARIDVVKREMAWEAAKHEIALRKLQSRFTDCVECGLITVKAFQSDGDVSSFRLAKLSEGYYKMRQELERKQTLAREEELARQAQLAAEAAGAADGTEAAPISERDVNQTKQLTTSVRGNAGERIIKALAKVDEKKRRRAARQGQWQQLINSKPDADYEDPDEVAAIKEAEEHMGDYKLKSASDYVVPDHLRMNTEKALMKLLILKEQTYNHKHDFNQRLIALRDKKLQVIQDFKDLVAELKQLQSLLGKRLSKPIPEIPSMYPCELPEKKYECSRETLVKFQESLKTKAATGFNQPFGLFGGPSSQNSGTPATSSSATVFSQQSTSKRTTVDNRDFSFIPEFSQLSDSSELNDFERKIKQAEEIRLLYKQDRLLQAIDDLLKNFDAELNCLRHEKFRLDVDMKNADLRQIVLHQELVLLKEFEKSENVLSAKLMEKLNEKANMEKQIAEVNAKLEMKKKDIDKLMEKDQQQWAAFRESIGDSKFVEFLTRVYKKKIRRSRKKASEGQGGDDDSDSDSDDDSDMSESEEESDSELGQMDLDVCPPGCDQSLYDSTCLQREKRLDTEENLAEERKNREALAKELDGIQKRAKAVEGTARSAAQELEAFQLQKQRHLNELDITVALRLHQIEYIINGSMPSDLSHCLVFEASGVSQLQRRIQELEQERILQKRQQRDAKKQHVELVKDRRLFDQRIARLNDECDKLMVEKFGSIVNIEKLETVTVNRQIEEVKDRLSMAEAQCSSVLQSWNERIQETKDELNGHLRTNTERLDQLTTLLQERKAFEGDLNKRQKNLGSEFRGVRSSELEERRRLVQLVQLQAQEIEALKDEIVMLSRKGGHVVPPTQPPPPRRLSSRSSMSNGPAANT